MILWLLHAGIALADFPRERFAFPRVAVRCPLPGSEGRAREFTWQGYDLAGNRTQLWECSSTNNAVIVWATNLSTFDEFNRVRTETVRDGATTTLTYDALGNVVNRAMPGGLTWTAVYTNDGRMLLEYDSAAGTYSRTNLYAYFAPGSPFVGLLQTRIDGRRVTNTLAYDDWLRPASHTSTGPSAEHNLTTTWTFDVRGLLVTNREFFANSATGPAVTVARGYDVYGQLLGDTNSLAGASFYQSSQSWTSAGRREGIGFGPFGLTYFWRADGTLASATSPRLNYGGAYTYNTAGRLLSRTVGSRTNTITARDGAGHPLALSTVVAMTLRMTEALAWRSDGRLTAHTIVHTNTQGQDFTNAQTFAYASGSRRLTNESLALSATSNWVNQFAYDAGQPGKLGVLTRAGRPSSPSVQWSGGLDALQRITTETNTVSRVLAMGKVNGVANLTSFLNGQPMPVAVLPVYDTNYTNWPYRWHSPLELATGVHQLKLEVSLPLYTTNATASFTNRLAPQTVTVTHDGAGQVTQRVWKQGTNVVRTQTLQWDGRGRLWKVTERDAQTNGYNWSAVYDPLGRRLRTTTLVTNSTFKTNVSTDIVQYFDPEMEFLELGVSVNGQMTWKLHGPDSSGAYGARQGAATFEAIAPPPDLFCPVLADTRGNLHAVYDQRHGDLTRFKSRVTGYGAVPGYRPPPLGFGADAASGSAWRGTWCDITGYYWRGHRYYDPESHRWLSGDPLGHAADPSLMTFCGGDPINFDDPDGLDKNPAFSMPDPATANPWSDYVNALVGMNRWEAEHFSASERRAIWEADVDQATGYIAERGRWNDSVADWVAGLSGVYTAPTSASLGTSWRESVYNGWMSTLNVATLGAANSMAIALDGSDMWGRGSYSTGERVVQGVSAAAALLPGLGLAGRAEGLALRTGQRGASYLDVGVTTGLADALALQQRHAGLIRILQQEGQRMMPGGTMSAQLMAELTVATGREVALLRVGGQRVLRLGTEVGFYADDASRVIAHTHPSGVLNFSNFGIRNGVPSGDIPSFWLNQPWQRSSVLIGPSGRAVRLPIPDPMGL